MQPQPFFPFDSMLSPAMQGSRPLTPKLRPNRNASSQRFRTSTLCRTALRRPKSRWGVLDSVLFSKQRWCTETLNLYHDLLCEQGVCQDHQASLHSTVQPVHPERGRPERHSQHQQRGGGTPARARHHRWCPLSAQQAAGCLSTRVPPPPSTAPAVHLALRVALCQCKECVPSLVEPFVVLIVHKKNKQKKILYKVQKM